MLGSGEKWFDPSVHPAHKTSPRADKTAQWVKALAAEVLQPEFSPWNPW